MTPFFYFGIILIISLKINKKEIKNVTHIISQFHYNFFYLEEKTYYNCYYEKIGKNEPVKLDDLPFDIPDNWTWVRINNYVQKVTDFVASGSFASLRENVKYFKEENYALMVKTQDFQNNFSKDLTFTDKHGYEFLENSNLFGGELVLANVGSIGKVFIVPKLNRPMTLAPNSIMVRFFNDEHLSWLLKLFQSSFGLELLLSISSATAIKKFNKTDFKTLLIPLPPLEEQQRIVDKIDSFEPLLQEYEGYEKKLTKLESTFAEKLKKSILQYAIEGKLVKQDPNDEPASVLLERIKAEKEKLIKEGKIKRDKNESYIYQGDDKNYYEKVGLNSQKVDHTIDIPCHWKWVQIKDIFIHSAGKALNSADTEGKKYPYITTSNVYWNSFILENLNTMYYKDSEIEKCSATKGDLLVLEGGDIGRAAIWNYDYDIRIQNHIHRLRPLNGVNVDFYYLIFFLYKNSNSIEGRGIGLQGLSANRLKSLVVPLPPYKEQLKVVETINKIFEIIIH